MSVFHKATLQTLKKNRTRTIVTIVGVILSAAMICAVTTFASSIQNYAMRSAVYSEGNWYGRTLGTKFSTYEFIRESKKTEGTVYLQELGYSVAQGCQNEFKPYIYLLGAGQGVEDTLPIRITSGRFPSNSNEILLPLHLYSNGGVKHSIGEQLTLSLGQRVLGGKILSQDTPCYVAENGKSVWNGETLNIRETREYTVVGFYERLTTKIEEISAPGYTAFTVADSEVLGDYVYDIYFRTKKPSEIYSFMSNNNLGIETNRELLMLTGTFRFDTFSKMLYSLAAIVILLIMFGSIALIYNAFSISVSERTKQFGLLSSVGATKKQLRHMVFFEALVVSIVGIPIGALAGVGGIGVTLLLIGNKFRSFGFPIDMTLSVSPASAIIAAAAAFVTVFISAWIPSKRATKVSAVEAIRQNQDITARNKTVKTPKFIYKLFGLPGVLANKYYNRNRKKYRATVLSLFMSIVLFVSASAFTDYMTEVAAGGFQTVGYDLSYFAYPDDFDNISPDELLSQISSAKSVKGCTYARESRACNAAIRSEFLTKDGRSSFKANYVQDDDNTEMNAYLNISFVNDETFRSLLKSNGLNEEKFMDSEHPLALALDRVTQFNAHTKKYETAAYYSRDEFTVDLFTEKKIPGYTLMDVETDANGKSVYRYIKDETENGDGDGEIIKLTEMEAIERTTLNVGKVINKTPDFIRDPDDLWLIYPISFSNGVIEDFDKNANYAYYYAIKSDNHMESETAVRSILGENGFSASNLFNMAQERESERNLMVIIKVFSYGFIVLISLIAAANVFNTISTNISLRRREFAMLKSVGMAQKDFNRMMNYECLLYGSRALLYGLPVSCVITYLIYKSVVSGYETSFRLPLVSIAIAVFSIFLVVFVTMIYAMSKIKKDNPIDALKNENL